MSYHQVIADTSLLILPIGLVLVRSLNGARTRRDEFITVLACLTFVSPTILLFANTRFYLLALPVGALFVFWVGQEKPSPKNLCA